MKKGYMEQNKRILAVLFSVILVASVVFSPNVAIQSRAENESGEKFTVGDFVYAISGGDTVTLSQYNGRSSDLKIRGHVDYNGTTYTVTEIGEDCFFRKSRIKTVAIPNTVTGIKKGAFCLCRNLESVSIPDSVTFIGEKAFWSCDSLEKLVLPNSVTCVENYAFCYCINLTSATLPSSLTELSVGLFADDASLTTVTIPSGVKKIDKDVFEGCNNLTSITLPDSLTELDKAFEDCGALNEVYIPSGCNLVSGSTGKDSSARYYTAFSLSATNGSISVSAAYTPQELIAKNKVLKDDIITVSATPNSGYKLESLVVIDSNNQSYTVANSQFSVKYQNFTIKASFINPEAKQNNGNNASNGTNANGGASGSASSNTGAANGGASGSASSNTGTANGGSATGDASNGASATGVTYSSEWMNGKWYNADGSQTYESTMSWKSNSVGWWIEDTSGWYPVSQWQKIDGYWYYFNADGYMASNEWRDGYYLSGSGALTYDPTASWKSDSTGWYFVDTSGWYPYSQWTKINSNWYYFDGNGYMVTSKYIDGYWIDSNGVCK